MKNLILVLIASVFIVACTQKKSDEPAEQSSVENNKTEISQMNVADFEKEAPLLVGKEVKIKGIVDHVCKHGGKKLLLVGEGARLHAYAEQRIEENLVGNEVYLYGVVEEERIDESTCLKMENDCMNAHKEGEKSESELEATKKQVAFYRDSLKAAGTDHLSFYSVKYISASIAKEDK